MAIGEKLKKPYLDNAIEKIINRDHKEGQENLYNDIDRYKYFIMKALTDNQNILWTLHNEELETYDETDIITNEDGIKEYPKLNGDAYRDVSIYNFLKIPDIQSKVKNMVCFEVNDVEPPRYREDLIVKNIIFRTVSHEMDYKTDWGIARQDLLALIIQNDFDWSNIFGMHLKKIYDKGKVAENGYYYREFIYETTVPNNIVNQFKNGGQGLKNWNDRNNRNII